MNLQLDEKNKIELLEDLKILLSIRTVKGDSKENAPFGEEIQRGLNSALEITRRIGFKSINLDNYIGYAEYGEGDEYVAVLGHLDVVPEGSGWSSNPYCPEIKDGKIYARGTIDDKGPLVSALYGLKLLKDSNIKLSKKVRIIFGTNEESGTEDIDYYLSKEKAPLLCFTPDSEFPIVTSEKGILTFELIHELSSSGNVKIEYIRGGKRSNIVPDICECKLSYLYNDEFIKKVKNKIITEKYNVDTIITDRFVIIKAKGKSTHGSTPELGENAISNLVGFLGEVFDRNFNGYNFVNEFNKYIGYDYTGEKLGINYFDEESGHLTMNVGIIEGDSSYIKMRMNVRYPVTDTKENIIKELENSTKDSCFNFKMGNHNEPLHFPKEHPLIKGLSKAYKESTGLEAKLLATGGGTYAKLMPNTVAFGPLFPGMLELAHQANEYIEISLIEKCVEIYARAIYELAK